MTTNPRATEAARLNARIRYDDDGRVESNFQLGPRQRETWATLTDAQRVAANRFTAGEPVSAALAAVRDMDPADTAPAPDSCEWGAHDAPAIGISPNGVTVCADCAPVIGLPISALADGA